MPMNTYVLSRERGRKKTLKNESRQILQKVVVIFKLLFLVYWSQNKQTFFGLFLRISSFSFSFILRFKR